MLGAHRPRSLISTAHSYAVVLNRRFGHEMARRCGRTGRRSPQGGILAVATQGAGGDDEARLLQLLSAFSVTAFPFDRRNKRRSFLRLLRVILRDGPELVVMEGTGLFLSNMWPAG